MNVHTKELIQDLLKTFYGIEKMQLEELEGYDSSNYKVSCTENVFILKEYEDKASTRTLLKGEDQILSILSKNSSSDFPTVIPSIEGDKIIIKDGKLYRLLTFIEGEFLGDVDHNTHLIYSLGHFLGNMDKVTVACYEPAIASKEIQWDLQHFKNNLAYLPYIKDPKERSLVDYFFLQYDELIYPVQHLLRKGIIHNDANDWNVLTTNGKVTGIIDFGDMCYTWIVNEIAVALTYVMMDKVNPLETATVLIKGYHEIFPLRQLELDILYYLIAARLCTSVCNSAYTKTQKPHSEYITISERPAWRLLRKMITINPIRAQDEFRRAAGFPPTKKIDTAGQLQRRNTLLSSALSLSYEEPIAMSRSAFQYMYDSQGNAILDAYNNIMLSGHCHPKVVRAGQKAMARLNTNTRYIYEEILAYSEKLLSKFPDSLNKVFYLNSGSAASDLAIRLAMNHTRKNKLMVLEHGYHGNTQLGISISAYKYNHNEGPGRQENVVQVPLPNAFGSNLKDDGRAGAYFADLAISEMDRNKNQIAAFIAEPIVGCGGQVPLAKGYLKKIYPKIREQGGVCISDEVQVGFGRLGDFFWGFEMHGVLPDIVILGKPMGNGHPIGAVVTTHEIAKSFENGPEFFSSFGGNPVSCAIGKAVLEVIEEENLQQHAKETGDYLINLLRMIQNDHFEIGDVRGSGLFLGVEFVNKEGEPNTGLASHIKNLLRKNNILTSTDGPYDNVLKIKPPLSFTKSDCDVLVETILTILTSS